MFTDNILWFFVGPISLLSILLINFGFVGIFYFIKMRNIKYVYLNILIPFFDLFQKIKLFYRTVLLHSERMIHFYGFSYSCSAFPLDVLRIYFGPFSDVTCWWYKFFKNFGGIGAQLSYSCTIIIRVSASLNMLFNNTLPGTRF